MLMNDVGPVLSPDGLEEAAADHPGGGIGNGEVQDPGCNQRMGQRDGREEKGESVEPN